MDQSFNVSEFNNQLLNFPSDLMSKVIVNENEMGTNLPFLGKND